MFCTGCKQDKQIDDFGFRDKAIGTLRKRCKACVNNKAKERYMLHHDEILKARAPQREATRAQSRSYAAAWAQANRSKRAAARKAYKHRKRTAIGWHGAADIQRLYAEQDGHCKLCGILLGGNYHVDHIVPLSRGGSNDPSNLQITCGPCNLRKGAKLPTEFSLKAIAA